MYDQDPLVRVQIYELDCEYAYSAPTGKFNLQVPHVEARNLYQNQSYSDFKRSQYLEAEKKAKLAKLAGHLRELFTGESPVLAGLLGGSA